MRKSVLLGLAATSLTWAVAVAAQDANDAAEEPTAAELRDPETLAALDRMGAALRAMTAFTVKADITREDVLTTGQKIQYGGNVTIKTRRPDAFRIDSESARKSRSYYFDGQNLTVVAPRAGYYATVATPGTIQSVLEQAGDRYDIEFPLADLFAWGTDAELAARITAAFPVATETIAGQACDQHALRQEGVDWQIWLRQGDNPLPCKLVITSTDDPSMPQYSALLTWEPNQAFAADTFTYTPSAEAKKIELGGATVAAAN